LEVAPRGGDKLSGTGRKGRPDARHRAIIFGQRLDWIEDGLGGFRVVPHPEDLTEATRAHEEIMAEYDGVFRELAK
jgi:hypothetical protein